MILILFNFIHRHKSRAKNAKANCHPLDTCVVWFRVSDSFSVNSFVVVC